MLVKFQTQSFKVARYCVRKKVKESEADSIRDDAGGASRLNPLSAEILDDTWRTLVSVDGPTQVVAPLPQGVIDVESAASSPVVGPAPIVDEMGPAPMSVDAPDSEGNFPAAEVPAPSSPSSQNSLTPLFERLCGDQPAPGEEKDPPAPGLKRPRSPLFVGEKRARKGALQVSVVGNENLVKDCAQWWNPIMKPHINLAAIAPLDGVESAISAWVAFESEMILGQELSALEEQMHADLVISAEAEELAAWKQLKFFSGLLQ